MSGRLRGGGGLVTRFRLYPPLSSSSQYLLHPPPPSFHPSARQYTIHRTLPRQLCLNSAIRESAVTSLSSAWLSTSPLTFKTRPKVEGSPSKSESKGRQDDSLQPITLIDTEDKVSTMSLNKAERLAKRRDLKLVKIEDPSMRKSNKEVYRLLTGKQYFEEQIKAKKSDKKPSIGGKDEKILAVRGKISPHDLAVKLHSVTKWLSKGHQIKVSISSKKATKEDMENVFSTIEEEVKKVKGRILQRHEKMDDIRFYIAPSKEKESVTNSETTQGDNLIQSEEFSDQTKA